MRFVWLFLIIWFPLVAQAVIYVKEDGDSITYSDSPIESGKKLEELPAVNNLTTTPPTAAPPIAGETTTVTNAAPASVLAEIEAKKPYNVFLIASPKDQETFQNQPVIPVDIKLEPSLQDGDKIMLLLDDKPWGAPSDTNKLALSEVERGFHVLGAVIIDKDQKILKKSNVITIYIHKTTLNSPARQTSAAAVKPTNLLRSITSLFS